MQILVRGHNVEVTPPLRKYATKKIEKMELFLSGIVRAEIELVFVDTKESGKTQACKVNMWVKDLTLRAEAVSGSMYASIDAVFDNLENQIKKYKAKHRKEGRRHAHDIKTDYAKELIQSEKQAAPLIVPVRSFVSKPLSEEEAKAELKVLDHEFIVFSNRKTKCVNVAVKKNGGIEFVGPENSKLDEIDPETAMHKLNRSKSAFIMFKNLQTSELNVLYRRKGGDFGLIEPRI